MSLDTREQILNIIEISKLPLITFRPDYTVDGIASALALKLILKKIGKENTEIASWNFRLPKNLNFLPEINTINNKLENVRQFVISLDISKTKVDTISYSVKEDSLDFIIRPKGGWYDENDISAHSSGFKNDVIFVLNTPDLESLGQLYDNETDFFYQTPILNIDHKPDNEQFGQINMIELTASSAAEIIGNFFYEYDKNLIDEDVATCLLTGMMTKTKSWQAPNITPQALTLASNLMARGARREEIMNNLYRSRSLTTLRLWGRMLARLQHDSDYQLAWSVIPKTDFDKAEASEEEITGVIDELISNAPEAKIIVLIYQKPNDDICALVNTSKQLNAQSLVKEFQAEGSQSLAKFCLKEKDLKAAEEKILSEVKRIIDALPPAVRET